MGTRDLWHRACVDPVFFCREFLEVEPHHGQLMWLQKSDKAENLLCTGNRWGKSQVQAIKLLHYFGEGGEEKIPWSPVQPGDNFPYTQEYEYRYYPPPRP